MRAAAAFGLGYLVGSIPTAEWIGRIGGVDLRRGGSGNPGAANARRLGGSGLAARVLAVEMGKGAAAVSLVHPSLRAAAGVGAVAGNVFNPWYRMQGGQGLGITAGVLLGCWPAGFAAAVSGLLIGLVATRSSRIASLTGALALLGAALRPLGRGDRRMAGGHLLLAAGVGAVVSVRQVALIRGRPGGLTVTPRWSRR